QGNAQLRTITEEPLILPMLQKGLDLLEAHGGDKANDVHNYVRPFLLDAGPALIREGRLLLRMLHVNDEPIGCVLAMKSAAGPLIYNVGFDPNQKQWSPGTVSSAIAV